MSKLVILFKTKLIKNKKVKYLAVGGSAFLLEYLFFLIFNNALDQLVIANIASFLVGFSYSFYLHLKWTFNGDHRHKLRIQFISYGLLALINLTLSSLIISLLVDSGNIAPFISKIICMLLVITWNFIILNKIIFKTTTALDGKVG